MLRASRDRAMTLAFVAVAYALAFWQRPGVATSDTKIDLHVDPARFLSDVASVWTPTSDLGEVHSAQYSGYLWPMGPFFAAFHALGLSPWVVQRLWLGLMLALAAWGCLKLLDELIGRPRGIVHVVATLFFVVNPYTVVFTGRTSITLLGYAALPWLLLAVWKGVRLVKGPAAWWWPALFALIFMSTGGGVNAAVVFWMSAGPLVLLVYEPLLGHVRWRDSLAFFARAFVLAIVASLWWIVPLLVHVKFGIDFLQFTEQPRTIWATNSSTESLRLMGYWTSYIGVSFYGPAKPYFSDGATMLFSIPVVGASLLLPALAATSFAWTRRYRYAPFFVALVLVGVVIMIAGFPNGTPLRHGMEWVYENIFVLRFMRTVNKAAPLVALGLGGMLGLATKAAWSRVRARPPGGVRRALEIAVPAGLLALIVAAAWPLFAGDAIDEQITWDQIPAAWRSSGSDLNADLPGNTRAMVLPGQIFAFYKWGGTIDHVLPRLTDKPVAVRYETPYSDLHAVDLLLETDQLVQQNRLVPGQLRPLLDLMGVSAVVSGTDDDLPRSGAVSPGTAALALSGQGLGRADKSYGPVRPVPPAAGDLGAPTPLPQVRRYDLSGGRGLVHVTPVSPPTIVDGSAEGIAELAAFGGIPKVDPILYAGDLTTTELQASARRGASVVVSDSNRRRIFLPQHSQQNLGATIGEREPIIANAAVINPFDKKGAAGQTVSVLKGARYISATQDVGANAFPEHRPFAAFDGRVDTSWLADRTVAPKDRWIEIGFDRPRDVPYVDVYPANGPRGIVESVEIGGKVTKVGPGWTRIPVGLKNASALRVRLAGVRQPIPDRGSNAGLREVRVPGLKVTESLRSPVLAGRALAGRDLSRTQLTYLFSRTTGDDPFRRDPQTGDPGLGSLRSRSDGERTIDRIVFSPAPRAYDALAWVNPAVDAPDPALDRLAGVRSATEFSSSGRFHGQPGFRASSAFDGDPRTSWMGVTIPGEAPPPWIAWKTPQSRSVSGFRIVGAPGAVRRPTVVRVSWPGGRTGPLKVGPGGRVELGRSVSARSYRVTILDSAFPPGATKRERARRAVGIASLVVGGLKPVTVPRRGPLRLSCASAALRVGGRAVPLRPVGTIAQLDAGVPLRARGCAPARMAAGVQEIHSLAGVFSVDLVSLRSAAPAGLPASLGGGRVVDSGTLGRSSWKGVKLDLRGPSWVVLGESFDVGWRATCDGNDLGKPTPIDGYANGWRAPASCRNVAFSFAPQSGVDVAYAISAVVIALLLIFLIVFARRRSPVVERLPELLPQRPGRRLPIWQAAIVGLVAALPLAYVFSLRSGPPIAVGIAIAAWRGWGPKGLSIAAGVLLGVVVPLLYLVESPKNEGGYNFGYSVELIDAHWVGVAAIVMLGMACWLTVARALPRGRRERSTGGSRTGRSTPRPAQPVAMTPRRPDDASPQGS